MTNILILAAGPAAGDPNEGEYPLCLAELDGVSLIERIVDHTRGIPGARHAFTLLRRDTQRFHLDRVVTLLVPGALVTRIPESTRGSACSALLAACQLPQEAGLLIVSANELVDLDLAGVVADFGARGLDGGALTFRSVHPRYSYVRLGSDALVTEVAQQKPISQHATAGVFWFRRTADFVDAVKSAIRKNATVADQFFVAPTYNELILKQRRIGVYELDPGCYRPLKTERHKQLFEQGAAA